MCCRLLPLAVLALLSARPTGAAAARAEDDFPITLADIKKELGAPTAGDDDFLDYRGARLLATIPAIKVTQAGSKLVDGLNVRVSPLLGRMEVQAATNRPGAELAAKLFKSRLFEGDEGKAALELVKAGGGERRAGRFQITAKESVVASGVVLVTITPLPNGRKTGGAPAGPPTAGGQKDAKSPEPARHKRRTVAEWLRELSDGDAEARRVAAQALGAYGREAEEAVPALARALRDKDGFVRGHAARSLGRVALRPDVAVQPLTDALSDPLDFVRYSASSAVGEFGEDAVRPLIKAMREGKVSKFRHHATSALIRVGKPAVPALGDALADADDEVRMQAALALGEVGRDAAGATPALVAALGDRFFQVRGAAAQALGKIRPTSNDVVAALNDAVADRNRLVRIDALCALAQIDPRRTEGVVKRLIEYGDDEEGGVPEHAAEALGRLGQPAVDLLVARLKEAAEDGGRIAAASRLAAIGKPAVASLTDLLESEEEPIRVLAALSLSQIGPDAKDALPRLRQLLKTARGPTARAVDLALKKIGGEEKRPERR